MLPLPPRFTLFPYTTLFRSWGNSAGGHLALMLGMIDPEVKLEVDAPYPGQSAAVQSVVSDSGPIDLVYQDRKSTRLNSSHRCISYAVFCLKKKKKQQIS